MNSLSKPLVSISLMVLTGCILLLPACSSNTADQSQSSPSSAATTSASSTPVAQNQSADPLTAGSGTNRPGASPLDLMQNPQVSKELKLTPDQLSQIKQINDNLSQGIKQSVSGVNWVQLKGNEAEQKQLEDKIRSQIQTARDEVGKILKPDQLKRFKEISLQVYGFGILSYDQFTQELGLTAEQQKSLNTLRQDTFEKIRANLESPESNDADALKRAKTSNKTRSEQILKESNQKALDILTPEQKSKLESLKGKPFNLNTSQPPTT